jgi:hypothetical protein
LKLNSVSILFFAACPKISLSSGQLISLLSAEIISPEFLGETNIPVFLSSIISGIPPTQLAMTGSSALLASISA